MVERLNRAFDVLAANPEAGRLRADVGSGVRSFVVGKYVVFYRAGDGGVDIGRVMHGARHILPQDIWRSFSPSDEEA